MIKWPLVILSSLLLASVANNAVALQIKSVVDNETTNAKISSVDVTRIFVQGDRIKSVKGLKGAYTRENDEKNGEIYLQPSSLYQDRAFTILIDTELGRHFTLLLTPTGSPSETLMLVPKGVGHERATRFEQASPYELTINHLVRAMKNGVLPEGYVVREINNKTTYKFKDTLSLEFKTVYEGLNLRGEIVEVTNKQTFPIQLDEREFYKRGTRAISLDTIVVEPKATIHLYRVLSNDR
jgi:conjugal transfer pilus assembly protein TraK